MAISRQAGTRRVVTTITLPSGETADIPMFAQSDITGTPNLAANTDTAALLTYTAAAAGSNGADQTNTNSRGVKLVIDITALTGTTPTLTVTLQGKDAASGKYYTILASAALAAVATTVLTIYPGQTAAANIAANDVLPKTWRVIAVIAGTTPAVTATVGASVIV